MKIAVYPGSFDPVTNGHLDIIERASRIFDKVIVAVLHNPNKTPLFTMQEREELLKETCSIYKNVEIDSFSGLLINYMQRKEASIIIKGLRAVSDFEYEFQMALMNRTLANEIETVFMMPSNKFSYVSSSLVKEVAKFGGSTKELVPEKIEEELVKRYK